MSPLPTSFRSLYASSSTLTPISPPIRIISLPNSFNRFYGLSFSTSSSSNLVFSTRKQSLYIKGNEVRHVIRHVSQMKESNKKYKNRRRFHLENHRKLYSFFNPESIPLDHKLLFSLTVQALAAETEQPKWWERKAGPNMIDITSTEQFLNALKDAGDRLVIVDFYGTWCGSCRAMFPKLCKTAEEHPEILFLKVNFDENKSLCKSLNVKVLPYFHLYRGSDGQVDSFSCSLAKFKKLREAIERHNVGLSSDQSSSVSEQVEDSTSSL